MRISDWSSDVCSSDLPSATWSRTRSCHRLETSRTLLLKLMLISRCRCFHSQSQSVKLRFHCRGIADDDIDEIVDAQRLARRRSAERRGGKEWVRTIRLRWAPYH